ncbi:MAG: HD domain-containing protein [Lachnotalea sp.]
MNIELYTKVENYMLECMKDSAHDKEHIYRVLYMALDIAKCESDVDMEILIISCLLHDIGREEQLKNPNLCHAKVGSEKAYQYLLNSHYDKEKASQIKSCILAHRFRSDNPPETIEAKILFDADKLDVTGTLGIARTLLYNAQVSEPIYTLDENGDVLDGTNDSIPSFFQEYKYKLEEIYDKFYTNRGTQVAKERQNAAISFYTSMLNEVQECYSNGKNELGNILNNSL